jgi:hypothetical protein
LIIFLSDGMTRRKMQRLTACL